jgi:glutathione S-transferase
MKLYYAPAACSLAAHIALCELGEPYTLARVDLRKHELEDGRDFYAINPNGYVPVLELDDGTRLTEDAVILQYVADRQPGTLAPAFGGLDRYQLMVWLNFIATEVHKGLSPLWKPTTPDAYRGTAIEQVGRRLDYLAPILERQDWLTGDRFTIADAYLFTILNWAGPLKLDLGRWPAIARYVDRVRARPKVQQALREEGLVKS